MQVDYALILSAGLGTRMGEIGQVLPKVMWPIFSKTLLALQIDYCRDLGINNIYINVHFLANDITKHVETIAKDDVKLTILHENPLLDSGGAIHNLAKRVEVNYRGNLLLVNGDQFLLFPKETYNRAFQMLTRPETRASLFGIRVEKTANYNETILENELLKGIQKNTSGRGYITYSGLGIVKLDGLMPVEGISKFFQTVVNYKAEKTYMITPENFEYWDFGTAEIYCRNILRIAKREEKQVLMEKFLASHLVDFSEYKTFVDLKLNSIDLDQNGRFCADTISFNNIRQKI